MRTAKSHYRGVLYLAAAFLAAPAAAEIAQRTGLLTPDQMVWQGNPSTPLGVRAAVLAGDPGKPGPYTIRVFLPAGTVVPPHFHSDDRYVTILSGHWATAAGEAWRDGDLRDVPPLTFYLSPARQPKYHVNRTDAVIQVNGTGPTSLTFVDPKDDPRLR